METCRNCGAVLAPDAEWCGQCLAPVRRQLIDPRRPEAAPPIDVVYSRWRAGPESFGPVGRGFLTLLLLLAVFVGYFLAQGGLAVTVGMEIPFPASLVMYGILAIPLGVWGMRSIWKRARIR